MILDKKNLRYITRFTIILLLLEIREIVLVGRFNNQGAFYHVKTSTKNQVMIRTVRTSAQETSSGPRGQQGNKLDKNRESSLYIGKKVGVVKRGKSFSQETLEEGDFSLKSK